MMPESGSLRLAAVMALRSAEAEERSMGRSLAKRTRVANTRVRWFSYDKKLFLDERVADLAQELLSRGGAGRRSGRRLLAQPVRDLDHLEEDEGNDQETDEHGDEIAVSKHRPLRFGCRERWRV